MVQSLEYQTWDLFYYSSDKRKDYNHGSKYSVPDQFVLGQVCIDIPPYKTPVHAIVQRRGREGRGEEEE